MKIFSGILSILVSVCLILFFLGAPIAFVTAVVAITLKVLGVI